MLAHRRQDPRTLRALGTLRSHLLVNGPATAQELSRTLALSLAETYYVLRGAAVRGIVHAVAHVHTRENRRMVAWDIDSTDGDQLLWRRARWIGGRFCTCHDPSAPRREARAT